MITVYSAGIEKDKNTTHLFLGRKQDSLRAIHNEVSLCDCVNFKDVNLEIGCVAIGLEEMMRKFKLIKSVKCKECSAVLKEIRINFR